MKNSSDKIFNVVLIIIIIAVVIKAYFPLSKFYKINTFDRSYTIETDPDSLILENLRDSLPYRIIKQKIGSIKSHTNYLNSIQFSGEIFSGNLSVVKSEECDTCDSKNNVEKYYLLLNNYKEIQDSISGVQKPIYFNKKGKFYKKNLVQDKTQSDNYYSWKISEIQFGTQESLRSTDKNGLSTLVIPISKTKYQILRLINWSIFILSFIAYFAFLFGNTIYILFDLYRGRVVLQNIYTRLKMMIIVLLAFPILDLLIVYISDFLYQSYFISDFVLVYDWKSFFWSLFAALSLHIIAKTIRNKIESKNEDDSSI